MTDNHLSGESALKRHSNDFYGLCYAFLSDGKLKKPVMRVPDFPERLNKGLRRVTTGIGADGRAVITADEIVKGDPRAMTLWATDSPPVMGKASLKPVAGWWPPPGGLRVTISSRAPDHISEPREAAALREWPDINDAAGFHASCSADIVIVISGTIWLELDDGVEVELTAGDTLIQNGTRHKWHNHGNDWPIMAVVIVGARNADAMPL